MFAAGRLLQWMGRRLADTFGQGAQSGSESEAEAFVIKLLFSGRDPHTLLNLIQPESKPIA
jgi:hypothetical protein